MPVEILNVATVVCPVQVTGFKALHSRREAQLQAARDLATKLQASQQEVRTIEDERAVAIDLRFRHYVERQQALAHRVLRLYALQDCPAQSDTLQNCPGQNAELRQLAVGL